MARKVLDLSQTLSPLQDELQGLLIELIGLKEENSPLFDAAINDFINKYGKSSYHSLDELLQSSALEASYSATSKVMPLEDLLKDLLP